MIREKLTRELRGKLDSWRAEEPAPTLLLSLAEARLDFMATTRVAAAADMPRGKRRCVKTHLPFCLLPPELLTASSGAKVRQCDSLCSAVKHRSKEILRCV